MWEGFGGEIRKKFEGEQAVATHNISNNKFEGEHSQAVATHNISNNKFKGELSQAVATHRMVLSHEPDTMVLPSGLIATLDTQPVCPSNVLMTSPEARSHTLGHVGRFRRICHHRYEADSSQHEGLTGLYCPCCSPKDCPSWR